MIPLESIRCCLEGAVPASIATCAPDGTPNIALLSQVHFVDSAHVALSFQFFNKTRENVLAYPHALVQVVDPNDATHYRLSLQYLRTETEGPLFESMKAKLAGIASHSGMSKVFRLQGSDIYRVLDIEQVPGPHGQAPESQHVQIGAVRQFAQQLAQFRDLESLLDAVLANLETLFDYRHSMVLMHDEAGQCLYTVASRGYSSSGVGSEIALGEGIIGVAAQQHTPIRINYMAREYQYSHAVRQSIAADNPDCMLESEIPLPGLPESHSQLAVPIQLGDQLLGILYTESPSEMRFSYEDEDALVAIASHLAMAMRLIEVNADRSDAGATDRDISVRTSGAPIVIRHYTANDSVFIGDDYLIKGVAGAIFWKLMRDFVDHRRTEFSNRELRLDPTLRLPEITDNLEARLVLLQRRLNERFNNVRIEKTGRGRFRLVVASTVRLEEATTPTR